MIYYFLRITWCVFWGVVAVLLVVLWVRSGSHFDSIGWAVSAQGNLYFSAKINIFPISEKRATVDAYEHFGGKVATLHVRNARLTPIPGTGTVIPYWLPVLITSLIAASIWLPYRFSLRALLIVTTLLAVILGLIVWVIR